MVAPDGLALLAAVPAPGGAAAVAVDSGVPGAGAEVEERVTSVSAPQCPVGGSAHLQFDPDMRPAC